MNYDTANLQWTMILSFIVKIITDILISTYGFFDSVL